MNILVVSNLYPPVYIGGYELRCYDIVQELRKRGHEITVLTSDYRAAEAPPESHILRVLTFNRRFVWAGTKWETIRGIVAEIQHMRKLRRLVAAQPFDVIFVFNMGQVFDSSLRVLQSFKIPMLYDISDTSLKARYTTDLDPLAKCLQAHDSSLLGRLGKRIAAIYAATVIPPSYDPIPTTNMYFSSLSLRCHYNNIPLLPAECSPIIYCGIDVEAFDKNGLTLPTKPVKILYSGRIHPTKGVHTVLEMLRILVSTSDIDPKTLQVTILGSGEDSYLAELKQFVQTHHLEPYLSFVPMVSRLQMPSFYAKHDILIFPSIWEEPFSLTLLEAMAAGLAIVSTTTGGSKELVVDGQNSLTFAAEDAVELAAKCEQLICDADLRTRLSLAGRQLAQQFDKLYMVDKIEQQLYRLGTG